MSEEIKKKKHMTFIKRIIYKILDIFALDQSVITLFLQKSRFQL